MYIFFEIFLNKTSCILFAKEIYPMFLLNKNTSIYTIYHKRSKSNHDNDVKKNVFIITYGFLNLLCLPSIGKATYSSIQFFFKLNFNLQKKIGAPKWASGCQNQLHFTIVEILIFKKWGLKWELKWEFQITSILKEFKILILGVKWGYQTLLFPNSNSHYADPNNGLEFF